MKPEATDRWFVQQRDDEDEERPEMLDVPPSQPLDSTMRIRRPPLMSKLALAGGAAGVVIVGCVIAIAGGSGPASAAVATTAVAPAISASAPPVSAPSTAPAPNMISPSSPSPSLSALHQPSSPKLAAFVRSAPARTTAGPRTPATAAKPHLRALPAKRPLVARARRR